MAKWWQAVVSFQRLTGANYVKLTCGHTISVPVTEPIRVLYRCRECHQQHCTW